MLSTGQALRANTQVVAKAVVADRVTDQGETAGA